MRRLTITLSAALMLVALAPASALARHHQRRHHTRVRHSRIEHFGNRGAVHRSSDAAGQAGTVQSFSNGTLAIRLNDGTTVTGAVTRGTELECMAGERSQTVGEDRDAGRGDQNMGEDRGDQGARNDDQAEEQNENEAAEENQNEAAEETANEPERSCSSAALTPGAAVHEADLRLASAGNVWNKVELAS